MLQRAASNAYSWWWASHIRTKQSKWLDNNLQDMEVKVENILKLIEEDGDSFAQKAEMYFRKRPELINFVEEFYRAYRALAERYDHISGDLHKANNTIATVFPDQLPLALEDDEEFNSPKASRVGSGKIHKPLPKVRKKSLVNKDIINLSLPKPEKTDTYMDKDKANEEIDKLQKGILVLQTEKEFIKSCYESNLAKYWDIEKKITEMQQEVCCLQDDFSASMVIEDDEARALMAATALKSCEDTLISLQEQQKRSAEVARTESERIKIAKDKLKALKEDQPPVPLQGHPKEAQELSSVTTDLMIEASSLKQERLELQSVCEKIKQHFKTTSDMSVEELAEKIDELVDKVINLEVTVSSQTAQIKTLSLETDKLYKHLQNLEEEKVTLTDDSKSLSDKLRCVEEELSRLQHLNKCFQDENQKLQMHFSETCHSFNDLSEKLQSTNVEGDVSLLEPNQGEVAHNSSSPEECNEQEDLKAPLDEANDFSNDLAKEVVNSGDVPDFSTKDQEIYAQTQETSALNVFTEKSLEQEDETQKTNYTPDDVTEKLVPKQDDESINADLISGGSTRELAESEHEHGTSKASHIPDAKRQQEDEVRMIDSSNHVLDAEQQKGKEDKKMDPSQVTETSSADGEKQMQIVEHDDTPKWHKFFLEGLEDREKLLLAEYTSILRNYKEMKRKLSEAEKKHEQHLFETMSKLRDLKNANAMKDEEIRSLRQKLNFLVSSAYETSDNYLTESEQSQLQSSESIKKKVASLFSPSFVDHANVQNSRMLENENLESQSMIVANGSHEENSTDSPQIKLHVPDELKGTNEAEEKFRRDIDELLEENLEFWLRFGSSFQQIQKFQTTYQDLQAEILKLKDSKKQEGSTTSSSTPNGEMPAKLEDSPAYQHLMALQNELSIWLEQNAQLKVELQCRFSSLCNIKDAIAKVSIGTKEQLTAYQAAKFHGEVLNMQQENNKVADELQVGMDHVKGLLAELEQVLSKLHQSFGHSSSAKTHNHLYNLRHFSSKTRIPLRTFLFGAKTKPKKPSIFSCMNPALQKQYSDLATAIPP